MVAPNVGVKFAMPVVVSGVSSGVGCDRDCPKRGLFRVYARVLAATVVAPKVGSNLP